MLSLSLTQQRYGWLGLTSGDFNPVLSGHLLLSSVWLMIHKDFLHHLILISLAIPLPDGSRLKKQAG
jgi:hypothetical protein